MEDSRVQGGGKENEKRAADMRRHPEGMGFSPNGHKMPTKGTGGTHNAKKKGKKHRGKRSSK